MTAENTHPNSRSSSIGVGEPAESGSRLSLAARTANLLRRIGATEPWSHEERLGLERELEAAASGTVVPAPTRSAEEVRELLDHISADDRLGYETAIFQVNAPLAAIQIELEARQNVLQWVLRERDHGGGSAGDPELASLVTAKESRLDRDLDADGEAPKGEAP